MTRADGARPRDGPSSREGASVNYVRNPFHGLAAEHNLLRLQLAQVFETDRTPAEKPGALAVLAEGFRLHDRRERAVLLPVCERLFGGPDGIAAVLRADHDAIRRNLSSMAARPETMNGRALADLRVSLERHFAREELVLFPILTAYLVDGEAVSLARRLESARP